MCAQHISLSLGVGESDVVHQQRLGVGDLDVHITDRQHRVDFPRCCATVDHDATLRFVDREAISRIILERLQRVDIEPTMRSCPRYFLSLQ